MYKLSDRTKNILEKNMGMTMEEIIEADSPKQIRIVESIIKKPLAFLYNPDSRKVGRGNPLLAMGRFKTMTEVDAQIDSIIKEH